ncbi:PqiB family protein [Aromatoleum sp.]|uniref:PqiB family protein n=1 Tax=Aromatoleum sp. TaxID=2307007 RepID=UPI002FC6ED41
MSEPTNGSEVPELPEAVAASRRRRGPQLVWIIPLVAALIGGWLAVKTLLERGPIITVSFTTGEGLEAGKTKIKYKDVEIGVVKSVALAKNRAGVVATAELAQQAESLLVEDTRLWVVRPRISGASVSGLATLLGGSYISIDVGQSAQSRRDFVGLETPPVVTMDVPGRHFMLRAEDLGSREVGSPIYFRRIQVGQLVSYDLDKDGSGVTLKVFVQAPYDQFVTENTRFWDAGGVDVKLDATGFRVDTQSLVSILVGGIAFQTPENPVVPVRAAENATFSLYANRELALKNPDVVAETYTLVFRDSVRGLSVGAPVDFRGIVIGEVTAIDVDFDPETKSFSMPVEFRFYPERLRGRMREGAVAPRDVISGAKERLNFMVERGLRAQLRTGSLLTGALYVAVDFFPDAPKAEMKWTEEPVEFPTVPGAFTELQARLTRIVAKLENVPLEAIGADLRRTLKTLDQTLQSSNQLVKRVDQELTPELRTTLEGARRSLAAVEFTMASEAPLQQDVRETLRDLSKASDSLRALADYLERHPESLIRGKREDTP